MKMNFSLLTKLPNKKMRVVIALVFIVMVGIFVRTYHFAAWLQFSPDEARDATLIDNVLTGKSPLPLLGPQAGNTRFFMGPLYYYFEYAAAFVFGSTPDKLAYPDLVFSILAIPLLFVFLRKYFSQKTALLLTSFFALSYFAIGISRFASNPNSIPFFALLFLWGLLELLEKENRRKWLGAVAVGMGMGVGVQLHALLFLAMPVVAVAVCSYLLWQKNLHWKHFLLVVACFLLVNTGQLVHETRTGGANIKELFKGANSEASGGDTLVRNAGWVAACQMQANAHIVSSVMNVEDCGDMFAPAKAVKKYKNTPGAFTNKRIFLLGAFLSLLFSVGGYALWLRRLRKEKDSSKRNFLSLLLLYNAASLVVLVPVASQTSVRYYNILFFVPFVLLGLWFNFWEARKNGALFVMAVAVMLWFAHIAVLAQAAQPFLTGSANDVENSFLGETQKMLNYVEQNSSGKTIFLDGQAMYLKRFYKPLEYLAARDGFVVVRPGSKEPFAAGTQFFYVDADKEKNFTAGDNIKGDTVLASKQFQKIIIYTLRKQ